MELNTKSIKWLDYYSKHLGFIDYCNVDKCIKYFTENKFQFIGEGSFRTVYEINRNIVIKLPLNKIGIQCNINEFLFYNENKDSKVLAKCSLRSFNTIPVLYMAKLNKATRKTKKDFWVKSPIFDNIDSNCQYGFDKSGQMRVFDYGNESHSFFSHADITLIENQLKSYVIDYIKEKRKDFLATL